jgi:cell division protein FtsW (lipid II flippase)
MREDLLIAGIDFRRRSNRRLACIATYVGYALFIAALYTAYELRSLAWAIASAPCALLMGYGWWVLNQVAAPYSTPQTDERQTQVRNLAFFRAYQIIAALPFIFLFYLDEAPQLAAKKGWDLWIPQPGEHFQPIIFGYLLLTITLPHAFIAWQDPDYLDADSPA